MIIYYYPATNETNLYNERFKNILKKHPDVSSIKGLNLKLLFSADIYNIVFRRSIVIVNWLEYLPIKKGGRKVSLLGLIKSSIYLTIFLASRSRLYFFLHDREVHDSRGLTKVVSGWFRRVLIKISDKTFCHSPIVNSTTYIPHPLYTSSVETSSNAKEKIVYVGAIQPYKKLHLFLKEIDTYSIPIELYGRVNSKEYFEELKELTKKKSVKIFPGFVNESDIPNILHSSKYMLIPHGDDSAIVSGNIFLALSYNKLIIARRTEYLSLLSKYISGIFLFEDSDNVSEFLIDVSNSSKTIDLECREKEIIHCFGDSKFLSFWNGNI